MDAYAVLQVKVWLVGLSPMLWRRVLVPAGSRSTDQVSSAGTISRPAKGFLSSLLTQLI